MSTQQPTGRPSRVTITVNGDHHEIDASATISDLLRQLQVEAQAVAVEVNRELVPRQHHGQHHLAAGDCLEIVTLVGGG